jgi:hypothetical protein
MHPFFQQSSFPLTNLNLGFLLLIACYLQPFDFCALFLFPAISELPTANCQLPTAKTCALPVTRPPALLPNCNYNCTMQAMTDSTFNCYCIYFISSPNLSSIQISSFKRYKLYLFLYELTESLNDRIKRSNG